VTVRPDRRPRRSCLTVPGSRPDMIEKSRGLAADQVILDLEDAVAAEQKPDARATVVDELERGGWEDRIVSVRVNSPATEWGLADLETLDGADVPIDTVVVPKVESPREVVALSERCARWGSRPGIEVLIETAAGLDDIRAIARSSDAIVTLILGPLDLAGSLGIDTLADHASGDLGGLGSTVRYHVLVAARAVGASAIDGPFTALDDPAGLRRSAAVAASAGFDGKWIVHPSQIEVVNEAFTPSAGAVARARSVLEALEDAEQLASGAVRSDGVMLDEATRRVAERILSRRGSEARRPHDAQEDA
jgi:citrate lyase subunit beta/citryl-CoA lyase